MNLDLNGLTTSQREERIRAEFNGLSPGLGFTFVSPGREEGALADLQARHPSSFEWHALEDGPDRWCVVVAKRAPTATRRRQVLEYMEQDHSRIHTLLDQSRFAARLEDAPKLAQLLGYLRTGLRQHIKVEETFLLPFIEERLSGQQKMVEGLRAEHVQVLERLEQLIERVDPLAAGAANPWSGLIERVQELQEILGNHSGIEERILYAVTDLLCSVDERDRLVRQCQVL